MNFLGSDKFSIEELFSLCVQFIKEKEGKAFHLSYQDRQQLSALSRQAAHGPYRPDVSPDVGWLDVVGSDRKACWQALGDLSREAAQQKFVEILDKACPLLKPHLEAHLNEKRERQRQLEEMERQRSEEQRQLAAAEEAAEAEKARLEMNSMRLPDNEAKEADTCTDPKEAELRAQREAQIRAALNQQTAIQFKQYAVEQHANDAAKQQELIEQLQEQHFQQYMTQVYQQQVRHQEEQARQLQQLQQRSRSASDSEQRPPAAGDEAGEQQQQQQEQEQDQRLPDAEDLLKDMPQLIPASMWTRQNLSEFKKEILRDSKHCCIKIGSLATATVRVPTHEEGSCIVWEFATDYYDIGFGVYFEWTISPSDKVTVHISESSDEEDDEETEGEAINVSDAERPEDPERGSRRKKDDDKAIDEIIPVYRRDCHEEVYCGSHQYPGRGVYLLKFDNSYSLWRSKWLYYRVYYTK